MNRFAVIALALAAVLAVSCRADNDVGLLERSLAQQDAETNAQHTWVVLVAGSTGYSNYRHQASVCHAYQVAHKFGVPDERIIVFMADDIAQSSQNPFPGAVYNYFYIKGGVNVNVYPGVPHDYTGENATADNLVAVMTGNRPQGGSGKVLASKATDNVFFYYDDHGNTDIIAMPHGRVFYAVKDLKPILDTLSEKRMFKNLVMFVQACYSGSMFYRQDLPKNVYVATSAPTDDSAYACWYDSTLHTFVTSCWPRGWLRPMEEESPAKVTFDQLFADAWEFTSNSTEPCQYGDVDVKALTMKEFFGVSSGRFTAPLAAQTRNVALERNALNVPQQDVPLALARLRYQQTGSQEDAAAVRREILFREHIDSIVRTVAEAAIPGYGALLNTRVCTKCDASCDCFNTCMKSGTADTCKRHCCGYASCYPRSTADEDALDCASTLVDAFLASCGQSHHDYLVSATKTFHRICRTPGYNMAAALEAIRRQC